jgi:ATP-dependent exoDNAse (exonuclease V) beta subunit
MSPFLIYKSSAGSGKTTALIGIFLRLALSQPGPEYFRRVLAITFTNKATNEMKERLLHEMYKLSKLPDAYPGGDFMVDGLLQHTGLDAPAMRKRAGAMFTRMLFDYGELSISTIDHFNHKLIRAFSRELNLRSDFQVELDERNLFSEAVMQVVARVGQDTQLTENLTAYIAQQQDEDKRVDVVKKLEALKPLVMREEALEPMQALELVDADFFLRLSANLKTQTLSFESEVRTMAECAMKIFAELGATEADIVGKSRGWYVYFDKWTGFPGSEFKVTPTLRVNSQGPWAHKTAPASIRAAVDAASDRISTFAEKAIALNDEALSVYLLQKAVLSKLHLIATLKDLREALDDIRKERNVLPISYFNRIVSDALRHEPVAFIYENLGARYEHILVDEFQDTSVMQWLNLLPLVEESISKGFTSLVVGDAKQSIYRWRGGKAEQLIALPEIDDPQRAIDPALKNSLREAAEIIALNTNYRSGGRVVNFNNLIFTALSAGLTLPKSLYRREYNEVAQAYPERQAQRGFVEVNYLGKSPDDEVSHKMLLAQIETLRSKGYRYSDCCILVRSTRKEGNGIATFLMAHGIPITTSDSRHIDHDSHVQVLISLLRLHLQPAHNPAKVVAIRALSTLRAAPFEPHIYRRKEGRSQHIDFDGFLRAVALPVPKAVWFEGGVYQACEILIRNYFPQAHGSPAVMALFNYILAKGGMRLTLHDFFQFWDLPGDKPSAGDAEGSDSVQMLTIHKAKGLQFKACLVPMLNWSKSNNQNEQWISLGHRAMDGLTDVPLNNSKMLQDMGLAEAYVKEQAAIDFDNLNLIYVALTRAEDALYINYSVSKSNYIGADFHRAMELLKANEEVSSSFEYSTPQTQEAYAALSIDQDAARMVYGALAHRTVEGASEEQTSNAQALKLAEPAPGSWFERFSLAFDPHSIGKQLSRKMGLYFHRLAAETSSLAEAERWTAKRILLAELDQEDAAQMQSLAEALYADTLYAQLCASGDRFAERELVYQGEVLRPDLVLVGAAGHVVIDFKTGEAEPAHRTQVQHYAKALEMMDARPVKAYLLYLDPLKWVEI